MGWVNGGWGGGLFSTKCVCKSAIFSNALQRNRGLPHRSALRWTSLIRGSNSSSTPGTKRSTPAHAHTSLTSYTQQNTPTCSTAHQNKGAAYRDLISTTNRKEKRAGAQQGTPLTQHAPPSGTYSLF